MNSLDRPRLARILGMLGSEHAGEVLSAARAAEQARQAAGATWIDILQPQPVLPSQPIHSIIDQLRLCREWPDLLNPWETRFVFSLNPDGPLSLKQRAKLADIVDKIESLRQRGRP